jgi:hypothetical protein
LFHVLISSVECDYQLVPIAQEAHGEEAMHHPSLPADENLPEVYTEQDVSPQALSQVEIEYKRHELNESDKYTVADPTPMIPAFDPVWPDQHGTPTTNDTLSPAAMILPWDSSILTAGESDIHDNENNHGEDVHTEKAEIKRICGFRQKTFFLIIVAALIIIAAAIGGGVGGGLAATRSKQAIPNNPDG